MDEEIDLTTTDGTDSEDLQIIEEIEEDEQQNHADFIDDKCEFCDIECGSNWFLKLINED
jgi:hypothetical protein